MISVEEYLGTSYESDCDYVDGEAIERNWGDLDHSWLQSLLIVWFSRRYENDGVFVFPELRVRVKPTRYRVPDICLTLGFPNEQILTKPPFLCIEILSPEDRMTRIIERIDDYREMGVAYMWVLDPKLKLAYTATAAEGLRELRSNVLKTENSALEVPLSEIFA
jgi:Uma2 family endonuclease